MKHIHVVKTNLHQVCESAGVASAAVCVTLFSISNAASRVIAGHFTDIGMQRGIQETARQALSTDISIEPLSAWSEFWTTLRTRPAFLIYLNCGMALSQLMAYFAAQQSSAGLLYLAVIVAGLSFGGVFPMIVIVTSELFGKTHVGGNVMFLNGLTGCVPALAFGKYLAQQIYHAHISSSNAEKNTCYGPSCFGMTHLIIAAACALGVLFSMLLACKSLPLYRNIWKLQAGLAGGG